MTTPPADASERHSLDAAVCERARLSRDARFDGLFFTAVRSTGIYCRPVCPAPTPKRENVRYYRHAAEAEQAGFRPCLRCRPELSPSDARRPTQHHVVAQTLRMIEHGALDAAPLGELARAVQLSERQLRRVFVAEMGTTPSQVNATRRLLFAKQLLTETNLPITDVAMAAGFASLRRFNASFLDAYRMAPRELRRQRAERPDEVLSLKLAYRPPFDFDGLLAFLRVRALPGIESVDALSYSRSIADAAWFRVARIDNEHALRLEVHGVPMCDLHALVSRVRRMFDLDANPDAIAATLGADPHLRKRFKHHPGLRIPGAWDGFEIAVRAVLGQQVSVAAARTMASRLVERFGTSLTANHDALRWRFPSADRLLDADLGSIGITRARADCIRGMARALEAGQVSFAPQQTLDECIARWTALPGIGAWTANYIALRGLSHPDAFLEGDLILRRAASHNATPLTAAQLRQRAEAWRPWRGYTVFHLWRDQ